ncbi:host translation inhibitory factor I [Bracoviriform glomeratae]|uniref:BV15alpha n=2 Tax=Bracoviriform TaxID=2946836 RepID=Q0GKX8_9VIRU|nr:host translation inhibitory factor I [Bracoviriform glomeratae]ABI16034.1 BV15alpha [Cotesia plutellae bracovirus]ACN66638.1 host translation inhibitory factor I [Bracoviriform glomeratae]
MNTFLFCFVLAVGLVGQAVTGAPNQPKPAPTGQGNANTNTGDAINNAMIEFAKIANKFGEEIQSNFNQETIQNLTTTFNGLVEKHSDIVTPKTKSQFEKVVDDIKKSGVSSNFNQLITSVGDDLSAAVRSHAKDISNPSVVIERINNYVKQITEPKRN